MKHTTVIAAAFFTAALTGITSAQDLITSIVPPSVVFEALALNKDLPTPAKPKYRSPTELTPSADGSRIYICEQTAKRITVFDVTAKKMLPDRILLPNEVTGCAVSKDGKMLFATCGSERWPTGYVCVVDVASGKVTKRIAVGHSPRSPVLSPDGAKLFVCNQFSGSVSVVDVGAQRETEAIKVLREPYVLDVTPDGKTLVVGHAQVDARSNDTMSVVGKLLIIDIETQVIDTVKLQIVGSNSVFGLTISRDGKYAFATHLIGRFTVPAVKLEQGWVHSNNLAVIDLKARKALNDVELDFATQGKANPWSVKCSPDSQYLVVSQAGSNDLSIINLTEFIDAMVAYAALGNNLSHDFSVMRKFCTTEQVTTKCPRSLAIVGSKVYTAGYFDDAAATMEEFELSMSTPLSKSTYVIGEPQPQNGERNGEANFNDASLCFQKWQSCASCHPQARTDGFNWMLVNESTRPRNTKSMVNSWWTPPTQWTGRRPHAGGPDGSIRMAIYSELMINPMENLALPLDTFLMGLKPVPSPFLEKGRLSQSARRGKVLYDNSEKTDCAKCHPAPLFTDNMLHNAGVPDPSSAAMDFNTPGLTECWRTGPYGHLGSYDKIADIVRLRAHSSSASSLSAQEFDDLVSYLLSL